MARNANKKLYPEIQTNLINSLVTAGANINFKHSDGWTALMLAAAFNQEDALKTLINLKADVNAENNWGFTAMSYSKYPLLSDLLKMAGAKPSLFDCVENNDLANYKNSNGNVNVTNNIGATPLILASMEGKIDLVKALITAGADVNASNTNGGTALMYITINQKTNTIEQQLEIINALIKAGADINKKNSRGRTSLMLGVFNKQIDAVKDLINAKADISSVDNAGMTVLSYFENYEMEHILKAAGAKPTLFDHVRRNNTNFLNSYNGNLNVTNNNGGNLLLVAASYGKSEMVRTLIKSGVNVNISDNHNSTALTTAAAFCSKDAVKELILAGANINAMDKDGDTPLICAAIHNNIDAIKPLIEAKANLNIKDNKGLTALSAAQDPTIIEILRKAGSK